MCEKPMCSNCGIKPRRAFGRCVACYEYFIDHGIERPERLWNRPKQCVNCGNSSTFAQGRCRSCYKYLWRYGKERPLASEEKRLERIESPKWCKICGDVSLYRGRRCHACYDYFIRNGKERPRHLRVERSERRCSNCGIGANGTRCFKRGLCRTCYDYKRETGKPRPQHLWGNGPAGWCECGQPANHLIDKFPLCDSCAVEYKKGAYS